MKVRRKEHSILIAVFLFCIDYCSGQCGNADSSSPRGATSILCSATNITINVELPSITNPDLLDLRVACRNDTREKEVDLTDNAHSSLQRGGSWTDTIPYMIGDTNTICDVAGCFWGERFFNLPTDSCFAKGYSVLVSTVTTPTVTTPSPFMVSKTVTTPPSMIDITVGASASEDSSTISTRTVSTPTDASSHQPYATPSKEPPATKKGHYYITLLAFPVMSFIFILGAMSCVIKQRIHLKRKKEIKFGNWITNDNSHYNATPISVQQAVIHYSESSSTLYSGLLYHNSYLTEAPLATSLADPEKVRCNLESKGYSSKADASLQPTFAADDTSKCSVYKNTVETLDNRQSDAGNTCEFSDFLVFRETRDDDQYVLQNRNQDHSEIPTINSEFSFVQVDDGIPSGHGNELPTFFSSSDGYIKN